MYEGNNLCPQVIPFACKNRTYYNAYYQ